MVTTAASLDPGAALLRRYAARRGLSISELSRRTGRDRKAIRRLLQGEAIGLKPWRGDPLFRLLVRELEIPEREVKRALAAHFLAVIEGRKPVPVIIGPRIAA
jgi:hypothetical protein